MPERASWSGEVIVWDSTQKAPNGVYRQRLPIFAHTTETTTPREIEHIRKCLHESVNRVCDDMLRLEIDSNA